MISKEARFEMIHNIIIQPGNLIKLDDLCEIACVNITLRQSRLSGVARATFPDKQSHLVINYCIMF